MSQSAENKKEIQALTNQLTTAQYIRRELNSKEMNQPLPTNSGIANVNIESQIGEYNKIVLDRNRLIANSSEKNPLVKDLGNSMQSMKPVSYTHLCVFSATCRKENTHGKRSRNARDNTVLIYL